MQTQRTVSLRGGPLDGMTFPAAPPDEWGDGAYMIVPGQMSRAVYEPDAPGEDIWAYRGDIA
ncbi:hypothetical protein [Spongiactinospora sp. 9N601]|uniref:hypothetical protein n=1 Tax=Spongiactinospora sp. 9N601 TaxID=3375149 RepID=UPI003790DDCD